MNFDIGVGVHLAGDNNFIRSVIYRFMWQGLKIIIKCYDLYSCEIMYLDKY